MAKQEIITLNRLYFQNTSAIDEGTQLELIAADENGVEMDIGLYPLCRFISKKKDKVLFEIYYGDKIIRFPIEELEKGIKVAKEWVKDERSFDS